MGTTLTDLDIELKKKTKKKRIKYLENKKLI